MLSIVEREPDTDADGRASAGDCDGGTEAATLGSIRVGGVIHIEATALERRPLRFDALIAPALIDLPDRWKPAGNAQVKGVAELLDRQGTRAIRVRGRLLAAVDHACDRCLRESRRDFNSTFDLYFYPMTMIEDGGEKAISMDETEVGFYAEYGIGLADVVLEQLLLWLPERSLCDSKCKGLCPVCGANWNEESCNCEESYTDPRWDALKKLHYSR